MSQYSGKCDLADTWEIYGEEYMLKSNIYIGDNIIPLRIDSYKDALPYFPFIEAVSAGDKDHANIWLHEESYVDQEERDILTSYLNDFKKYWRKCKRKKIEYTVDEAIYAVSWHTDDYIIQLAELVEKDGDKAQLPWYIHTRMAEYYRLELYNDMIAAGWDERKAKCWVYGWERAMRDEKIKDLVV